MLPDSKMQNPSIAIPAILLAVALWTHCSSFSAIVPGNQEYRLLNDNSLTLTIPGSFEKAGSTVISDYYPDGNRPQYLFLNSDHSIRISIQHSVGRLDAARLKNMAEFLAGSIRNSGEDIHNLTQGYEDFPSGKWGRIRYERRSPETAKKPSVLRTVYFTGHQGKPLFISLTCPLSYENQGRELMQEVLESVRFP